MKDGKTILYIGGFELPDKNAAAQRVVANAKILRSLGYSVYFIGIDKLMAKQIPVKETKSEYEDFTYYKIKYPFSFGSWINYLISIKSIIDLEQLKPSHIIVYNYPSFALFRLRKYCLKRNIYLLADCTEWYEAKGENFLFRIVKRLDVYFRMKVLHPKTDGIIAISKYLFDYYKTRNKNLIQVPPLVDISMDKWKKGFNINKDGVVLVYAGSPGIGNKDRIDKIIHALSEIKRTTDIEFKFNVLGLTKIDYLNIFGIESFPSNLEDIVFFKGRVTHDEALTEITKADFEIFIRDQNLTNTAGFPTKFVESISCGTPVITNLSSNIDEFLIHGENGFLIDISSSEVLVTALSKALNLEKSSILKMKSHCRSSTIFHFENYKNQFKLFLAQLELK